MRTTRYALFVAIVVALGSVRPADAQQPESVAGAPSAASADFDTRWLPWMGCWQLWEEQVERAAGRDAEFPDRTFVCMMPSADGAGAALTAQADGRVLVERTLIADAVRRDVRDGECTGWEERDWSRDGRRLFTRAELGCGTAATRTVNGVSLFSTRSTWVDIQLVAVGERQHLEIRRYNPVSGVERQALRGTSPALPAPAGDIRQARSESAESLALPSVREAADKAAPRVVEAMLAETRPRLDLDSATLIELDDAGIDSGVLDLLVALAYPDQFVVERRSSSGGGGWASGGFGSPMYYDPIWYGDLYPYYITPLGYGSWSSGYNPYFYGGGAASPFITLQNNDDNRPSGRAVADRGYTRVRPRLDAEGASGTRTAVPRGSGGASTSSPRSGSGAGSGGRVTSGGYTSRGTSGGDGGRTAAPRR